MQTRLFSPALAATALAVVTSACTTTANVMTLPGIGVNARELDRSDYVVLGDAEGKACVEESCVLGIFCSVNSDASSVATERVEGRLDTTNVQTSAPGVQLPFGPGAGTEGNSSAAEEAALFKAIQSVPDADALLTPRKSMDLATSDNFFIRSQKACVRVFGLGIRLKTDAELAGGPPPAPTPAPDPAPAPAPAPAAAPGT